MMNAETTKLLLIENISLNSVSYWAATFPKQVFWKLKPEPILLMHTKII